MRNTDTQVTPGTLVLATVEGDYCIPDGDYYVTTTSAVGMDSYHVAILGPDDERRDGLDGRAHPWELSTNRDVPAIDGLDTFTHRGWWVTNQRVTYVEDAPTTPERLTFGELAVGDVWGNTGQTGEGCTLWDKTGPTSYRRHGEPHSTEWRDMGADYPVERVAPAPVTPLGSERGDSDPEITEATRVAVRAERDRLLAEFEAWKDRATETAHQYANDNSLCSEFDRCMEEIGLSPREREWSVEIVQRYTVHVTASDADDAAEIAPEYLSGADAWETDVVEVSQA